MGRKQKRFVFIASMLGAGAISLGLILYTLNDNIVFFLSPSEILSKTTIPQQRLRIGGLVEANSLKRNGDTAAFSVTDGKHNLLVTYNGALPDLFREGQGVVAEGHLQGDIFRADTVFAKHDENYMPREVADALKKQGYWQENGKTGEAKQK
ncbi:MAG: cytochrome c maturation protein CcmE [Pseudomonadota bacterium]